MTRDAQPYESSTAAENIVYTQNPIDIVFKVVFDYRYEVGILSKLNDYNGFI